MASPKLIDRFVLSSVACNYDSLDYTQNDPVNLGISGGG